MVRMGPEPDERGPRVCVGVWVGGALGSHHLLAPTESRRRCCIQRDPHGRQPGLQPPPWGGGGGCPPAAAMDQRPFSLAFTRERVLFWRKAPSRADTWCMQHPGASPARPWPCQSICHLLSFTVPDNASESQSAARGVALCKSSSIALVVAGRPTQVRPKVGGRLAQAIGAVAPRPRSCGVRAGQP